MVNIAGGHPEVNNFFYTDEILDDLEVSLSRERLGTYLDATGGDREKAVRLHVWNTAVSAAFYEPLQTLEVTLRNAMNRRLGERYGDAWYDNDRAGLNTRALERISHAKSGPGEGHGDEPHRVVAALSFGFWVSLLGRGGSGADYEMTLWRPALRRTFPYCDRLSRSNAQVPLNTLQKFRNRIAHHEPIFLRNLDEEHELILKIAGWISPMTRTWIEHHSRVPAFFDTAGGSGEIRL